MTKLLTRIKQTTQLKWNRVGNLKPKVQFEMEVGPYVVKIADRVDELLSVFKLRYEVFHREFREIETVGLDIDKFDRVFDHLIIRHIQTDKIIGTYRLRSSSNPNASYTAQEFDLGQMHEMPGPYLELGRACIEPTHRKGAVISLLFRGIAEYMNRSGAQLLFGCSSMKVVDPRRAALIYRYLEQAGAIETGFLIQPEPEFRMPGLHRWLNEYTASNLTLEQKVEAEELIPSLVKSYVKMGAKIAGVPAFDRDFACIDVLTLLRKEDLDSRLARRFRLAE